MHFLVDTLLPYVLTYKYIALFIITFWGALLLPLPSGTIVAAATAFATQGYLNPWAIFIVAVAGNAAGDHAGYWLARKYGPETLRRLGFKRLLTSRRFTNVEQQIGKHPLLTIFFSRFLTAVAPTVNVVSGLGKINYKTYTFFEFTGEVAEVGMNFAIGYIFGSNWEIFSQYLNNAWMVAIAGMIFSYFVWRMIGKYTKHKARQDGER